MSAWGWLVSCFYALVLAILIILVITILVAFIAWAAGFSGKKNKCGRTSSSSCAPSCPVYLRNPHPDDRVFELARVDGSASGTDNDCSTGSFTIQRINATQLLYTVTTPADTFITDIYALEVNCERDFPLTTDGCAVDLTQFHRQSFPCDDTSNVQTFTSTLSNPINPTCGNSCTFVSLLVVFSDSETCDPVQMMTISGRASQPIQLTGNCITPPCPAQTCCDPVVPSFVKLKIPPCHSPPPPPPPPPTSSSSSSSISPPPPPTTINASPPIVAPPVTIPTVPQPSQRLVGVSAAAAAAAEQSEPVQVQARAATQSMGINDEKIEERKDTNE